METSSSPDTAAPMADVSATVEPGAQAPTTPKRAAPTKVLPSDRLAIERQVAALRAFAAVFDSNGGNPVSNSEAGEVVQPGKMSANTIVMTNAFFCDVGLLNRQDGGRFTVAPEVVEFLNAEHGMAPESAPQKLRPLFEKQWFVQTLTPRLRLGALDVDTVYKVIGEACSAPKEYRDRIITLVDFLIFVGVLRKEGNQLRLAASGKANASPTSEQASADKPKPDDIPKYPDLEEHALTLNPKTKSKIVIYAPHTMTTKELDRVKNWLSYQILIEDQDTAQP